MKIGGFEIGGGSAVHIIAEIGVNHDGDVGRALELIDAASDAGADAVKFQYFRTDLLMSAAARLAAYQKSAGESDPFSMLRRLELAAGGLARCVERAHARGVHAIVTVFSLELVEEMRTLGWDAYKTASPDIIHQPMLEALARTERPMIVSTGASNAEEVARCAAWVRGWGAEARTAFLHCVSSYPTAPEDTTLGAMRDVSRLVAPMDVGYSDHTRGVGTGRNAVSMGARILEKHLTYDRGAKGPDHAASLDPEMFGEYVTLARSAAGHSPDPVLIGADRKRVLECERDVRTVSRQSIVWARSMAPGEVVTRGSVTFKRPGTGIEPFRLHEVIGRRVARAVDSDMPAVWEDVA
ncbi:MAG: N-acetylneuraminate synthase family protein [Phycisphaerales bacterium]|nr:N-acetylneuraminate synthase family protein [Phycisphaerales bacterium]